MEIFNINLNIHRSIFDDIGNKLEDLYVEMTEWQGYRKTDGTAQWYGKNNKIIIASSESSGLQFYAEMPKDKWETWISLFKKRASEILGYEIGEHEEDFPFKFYD